MTTKRHTRPYLGPYLKGLRESMRFSPIQVAKFAGITKNYLSRVENSKDSSYLIPEEQLSMVGAYVGASKPRLMLLTGWGFPEFDKHCESAARAQRNILLHRVRMNWPMLFPQ